MGPRFILGFLLRTFLGLASRNIGMQKHYGVAGVTAVGIYGAGMLWLAPVTSATFTVDSIVPRTVCADGVLQERA